MHDSERGRELAPHQHGTIRHLVSWLSWSPLTLLCVPVPLAQPAQAAWPNDGILPVLRLPLLREHVLRVLISGRSVE